MTGHQDARNSCLAASWTTIKQKRKGISGLDKRICFIKTTYDFSLNSQISLLSLGFSLLFIFFYYTFRISHFLIFGLLFILYLCIIGDVILCDVNLIHNLGLMGVTFNREYLQRSFHSINRGYWFRKTVPLDQ